MPRNKQFDKEQVLLRAIEIFWKKGYHNTSVQDLVAYLGINRASLYDTYGDKYTLFLASLSAYQASNSETLRKTISEANDLKSFLRSFLIDVADRNMRGEVKGCFIVNSSLDMADDEGTCKIVKKNLDGLMEVFTKFFGKAIDEGQLITNKTPDALAIYFINVINGINITIQLGSDAKMVEQVINTSLDMLGEVG